MSDWLCQIYDSCDFKNYRFCGHEKGGPTISSYHHEDKGRPECYVAHAVRCLESWKAISIRWLNSITRLLRSCTEMELKKEHIQSVCELVVLHHDIGKLSTDYQNRNFYRHEILSTYVMSHCLKSLGSDVVGETRTIAPLFAAAIYLHHEALQISHGWFELRSPVYSYLLHLLGGKRMRMVNEWRTIFIELNQKQLGISLELPPEIDRDEFNGDSIVDELQQMINYVDGDPRLPPLETRLAISAILQPLTICDNLAAGKRGGQPSLISELLKEALETGALSTGEE